MNRSVYAGVFMVCCLLAGCAKPPEKPLPAAGVQPYVLENTEVRDIHAQALNRDYQIFVSLPKSYASEPGRRYPVLFVTDANYAFPLIRAIAARVGNHGKALDEFILIGLSYARGDTPQYSRKRDYTPTANGDHDATDMPGRPFVFGQADGYQAFIKTEVFPFVARTYRADMTRKIYAGHSYGGLLGINILLSDPQMFDSYIIGSPSLYYDHFHMAVRERAYAAGHKDMPAHVYMAAGGFETIKPGRRYNTGTDTVAEINDLTGTLKSRGYPNLHIDTETIQDEDHLTVFPALITRGLVRFLGK